MKKLTKIRNAGTMTEAAFWQFIRNSLRRRSMIWKPVHLCKENAKRPYKGTNKRQKYEYQCNNCKKYFKGIDINVDHINPVESLTCAADLPTFVENLFCEVDNLQCLCNGCHKIKTDKENASRRNKK